MTTNVRPVAIGNGRLITLRILSALVALAFLAAGFGKLAGAAAMIQLFDKVGLGQWFRYVTGVLEVAGAIGVLVTRYALYAAILLAVVMVGAVIAELTVVGDSALPPAVLLILCGIIAYLRKP